MMKLTDLIQNIDYTVYPENAALHALSVSDIAYNSKKPERTFFLYVLPAPRRMAMILPQMLMRAVQGFRL